MSKKHQHKISVKPADIDQMGHVNNVVYVRWVQEIAESHWFEVAQKEFIEKYLWVVLRHEVDYIKPALPGDELIGETWIEALEGARSIRLVNIKREETLLAKARTTWVMLDSATGKPARVPKEMQNQFLEQKSR